MFENKDTILKGLECCVEFLCKECPYQFLDDHEHPLRCIHTLITDIHNHLIVKCEDCDAAYPCFSPFDRKNFVRCTYLASGDGKTVCKNHFCKSGQRREDNACE